MADSAGYVFLASAMIHIDRCSTAEQIYLSPAEVVFKGQAKSIGQVVNNPEIGCFVMLRYTLLVQLTDMRGIPPKI